VPGQGVEPLPPRARAGDQQGVLLGRRQAAGDGGLRHQPLAQQALHVLAALGQRHRSDPTVTRGHPAFDQAALLETVGQAGHVRRVAAQAGRDLAHGAGARGELAQQVCLRGRERELLDAGGVVPAHPLRQPEQRLDQRVGELEVHSPRSMHGH
jgi:hypothetical protein